MKHSGSECIIDKGNVRSDNNRSDKTLPGNPAAERLRAYRIRENLTYLKLALRIRDFVGVKDALDPITVLRACKGNRLHETTVGVIERFLEGVGAR